MYMSVKIFQNECAPATGRCARTPSCDTGGGSVSGAEICTRVGETLYVGSILHYIENHDIHCVFIIPPGSYGVESLRTIRHTEWIAPVSKHSFAKEFMLSILVRSVLTQPDAAGHGV